VLKGTETTSKFVAAAADDRKPDRVGVAEKSYADTLERE
jgi:hypothetical protein